MLTPKQNFIEVHTGGNPDRFVNQFEFVQMLPWPGMFGERPQKEGDESTDAWGVVSRWTPGVVNAFPLHDFEHRVVKDIERWQDYVQHPPLDFPEEAWAQTVQIFNSIDRNAVFAAPLVVPGFFEFAHNLMGMQYALESYVLNPKEMHELLDYYLEYQIKVADAICDHIQPDMLFTGDDLGTHISSFVSPDMFKEFFLPRYKTLFDYWRSKGAEYIYLHNDSYSANLVPFYIEAGIDVWQGVVTNNNCPELVKQYGGQITFMGDIDSGIVDSPYWTPELIEREVRRACTTNGKLYFVPSMTMAGPPTLFEGVMECLTETIDKMSAEMFG